MGAILAGGMSTRFGGQPKGLATIGGTRLIDLVATSLRGAADDVVLIANAPDASTWVPGLPVRQDVRRGAAALSGIHAALHYAGDAVLVLPWDAPFVPAALLAALRDAGEKNGDDAVVAMSESPWGFEPLVAWYAPGCLPAIERSIEAGDARAGAWQHTVRTRRLDTSTWGDPALLFCNINTVEDLVRAEQQSNTKGIR